MSDRQINTSLKSTLTGGLGTRLLTSILLISILPLLIISSISYLIVSKQLEDTTYRNLKNQSAIQSTTISNYFDRILLDLSLESDRLANVDLLFVLSSSFQESGKTLNDFIKSPRWNYIAEHQGKDLEKFWKTYDYKNILLIDPKGNVLFSMTKEDDFGRNIFTGRYSNSKLSHSAQRSYITGEASFSDLEYYPPSKEVTGFFTNALYDDYGEKIGILAFQINDSTLKHIISQGLNESIAEEIYLVGKDRVIRSQSLKTSNTSPLSDKIDSPSINNWFLNGLNSEERLAETVSYEHKEKGDVIAVLQPFNITDVIWVIIAEVEKNNVYTPIQLLAKINAALVAISLLITTAIVVLITRRIVLPVLHLSQGVNEASQGNLDITVDIKDTTELGVLAAGYNRMITALKENEVETNNREWLNKRVTELNDLMRAKTQIEPLSRSIIAYICRHINAQAGIFYIVEDDTIKSTGCFSLFEKDTPPTTFNVGEGLVGQAVLEKTPLVVGDSFETALSVRCGLGEIKLNTITILPLSWNDKVVAALEIGTLAHIEDLHNKFLKRCVLPIAVSVVTALSKNRTQLLLERTQAQAGELRAQQTELCLANEDLTSRTDELNNQKIMLEKVQRETEEKAKALAEASKYKSEFLANMSHELRTPLNSLLILARSLAENEEGNLSDDDVESAEYILESGRHLLELINEILDLSKVEAGQVILHQDEVILSNLIDAMNNRFTHMAENKSIGFKASAANNVPASFLTDNVKLGQIITNLISNAIKFTRQGQVELEITFEENTHLLPEHNRVLIFSVKDSGIGIPKEKQAAIFEAFQQADGSTSRTHGGTGLGLSIALSFSKLLGGDVQLESTPNKGSTFTLLLPQIPTYETSSARDEKPNYLNQTHNGGTHNKTTGTVNIEQSPPPFEDDRNNLKASQCLLLIIEDDAQFCKILYSACHSQHCQAIVALDGETGLALANHYPVKGIILDYMLPGLDGADILAEIRSTPELQDLPVHIISALDDIEDIQNLNVQGQATKPIGQSALNSIIKSLSNGYCQTPQVLVIEAPNNHVSSIKKIMRNNNIFAETVNTGKAALEYLTSHSINAAVLSTDLPDMPSQEFLKKLKESTINRPLETIIYSEKAIPVDESKALAILADKVISGPSHPQDRLIEEIHQFLDKLETTAKEAPPPRAADLQLISNTHSTEPPASQKTSQSASINSNTADTQMPGRSVLLVDDDMRNTFALAKVLRKKDFQVRLASSGQQSLDMLDEYADIELVLMDIMMPEMDGYEAMGKIREQERFKDLPVIAVTANAMQGDQEKCLAAGANDYLSKPVDISKLISKMKNCLGETIENLPESKRL